MHLMAGQKKMISTASRQRKRKRGDHYWEASSTCRVLAGNMAGNMEENLYRAKDCNHFMLPVNDELIFQSLSLCVCMPVSLSVCFFISSLFFALSFHKYFINAHSEIFLTTQYFLFIFPFLAFWLKSKQLDLERLVTP